MAKAEEFQVVAPNLCVWSVYDPESKVDLYSTAYVYQGGLVLVDPVELTEPAWQDLLKLGTPRAILLTNGNHLRHAAHYRTLCRIPVAASPEARREIGKDVDAVIMGTEVIHGLQPISLPGACIGETAFLSQDGVLIIGDALFNLDKLDVLPAKYCQDARQCHESLHKLLDLSFSTVTFAHGLPLTQHAKEKLKALISPL